MLGWTVSTGGRKVDAWMITKRKKVKSVDAHTHTQTAAAGQLFGNCSILVYTPPQWTLIWTSVCCETHWGKEEMKWRLSSSSFPPSSPSPGLWSLPHPRLWSRMHRFQSLFLVCLFVCFGVYLVWFSNDHEMEKQLCLLVCRINCFCFLSQKKQQTKKEHIKCWWRSPCEWLLMVAFLLFWWLHKSHHLNEL